MSFIRKFLRVPEILGTLKLTSTRIYHIMTTLDDIKAALARLRQHVTDEAAQVNESLQVLRNTITNLQTQLAAQIPISTADLDSVLAAIDDTTKAVDNIVPPVAGEAAPAPVSTVTASVGVDPATAAAAGPSDPAATNEVAGTPATSGEGSAPTP